MYIYYFTNCAKHIVAHIHAHTWKKANKLKCMNIASEQEAAVCFVLPSSLQ